MVSKKRLDYGFNGYRAPIIPRAPRSIRKRGPHKNSVEDSKLCAFELLAAVAGKLLEESESSVSSNVAEGKVQLGVCQDKNEKGQPIDDKTLNSESFDHGSCAESAFVPETSIQEHNLLSNFKGLPQAENVPVLEQISDSDIKLEIFDVKNADGNTIHKLGGSICDGDSSNRKVECGSEIHSEDDKIQIGDLSKANTFTVKEAIEECVNTNVLINSESSVHLPLYRDPIPSALLQKHWNNVKLGIRDDDDNSFGCNKSSTKIRPVRPKSRIGHRRIRKMLTSKYRKVAPKLKDCELYNTSEGVKSFYRNRKRIYTRERCQPAPIKKRKLSGHRFAAAYQETSSDAISNLSEKATGAAATVKSHQKTKDPHVKFSIKSFKVPELYIEVPETASVGSLKRTVMEAVTAILGGGIRVGVVLQGKKVRDDNRSLQQAGISPSSNLETLGFTLEPSFTNVTPSMSTKKPPLILPCDADEQIPRSPTTPMIDSGISNASGDPPLVTKFDDDDVDNNEIISSPQTPTNELIDGAVSDSKALVPVPPMNVDGLAVVPVNSKPKRSELSQRRIRRPFSVAEVEALVAAVEKLGTGRWRDVKVGAFENADHRTYVDLKDKWKTLVHTASIAPQQRRGEPVPQELLNRVLSAHTYWSQNQSKQQGKHNMIEALKIENAREEIVGA
ncbi:hypothetical protein BUALT_Bualt01G0126600 [Buddleja alternifolia]|uniref:Uncharacterized protein n=1 Tax=Buddleja alternifolia TaxID=168488 RepID=A0AAV6Y6P7_9LAMI|nr:hypothetical protein BUALT_Bualt01G0126600 [Buddleja alternifolia]